MTTYHYTDILAPGSSYRLSVDPTPDGSLALDLEITQPDPEPAPETLLVGMEGATGAPTQTIVTEYAPWTMRDFGTKYNGESLPSLTAHGTGKLGMMPPECIPHVSWKADVNRLTAWLDGLTRPVFLTWYHEPMGDVTPLTYRTTAAKIAGMLAAHPNGFNVLGHGPILTRYWLDEGNGNPLDYWYDGATFFGIDWYEPTTTYKGAPAMPAALDKVRAVTPPGTRILVPEYGLLVGGAGRAAAIKRDVEFFRAQPDVDAVSYWNNSVLDANYPGGVRDYRLTLGSAESAEWKAQTALSA